MDDTCGRLVSELHLLASSISNQVKKARTSRESFSIKEFISPERMKENAGLYLLYPVPAYVSCFKALGIKDREELGQLCKTRYREVGIRDAMEDLIYSEEEFSGLISDIDRDVKALEEKKQRVHSWGWEAT